MKLIQGVLLTQNGDEQILITAGEAMQVFSGMIKINKTAAFIVNCLKEETTVDAVTASLLDTYEVEPAVARENVVRLTEKLKSIGILTE